MDHKLSLISSLRSASTSKNITYCKKGGNFIEYGALRQGERVDLDGARTMAADSGMRAVSTHMSYQQTRTAEIFLTYNERTRVSATPVCVRWLYGAPGSGKTRAVHRYIERDGLDAYHKAAGGKWFDGYDQHMCLVLDDIRSGWFDLSFLLKLIDRYEFRVEVKGGYRQMLATTIYITSVMHPRDLYNLPNEPVAQLLRRIYSLQHFTGAIDNPEEVIMNPLNILEPVPEVSVPEVVKVILYSSPLLIASLFV